MKNHNCKKFFHQQKLRTSLGSTLTNFGPIIPSKNFKTCIFPAPVSSPSQHPFASRPPLASTAAALACAGGILADRFSPPSTSTRPSLPRRMTPRQSTAITSTSPAANCYHRPTVTACSRKVPISHWRRSGPCSTPYSRTTASIAAACPFTLLIGRATIPAGVS